MPTLAVAQNEWVLQKWTEVYGTEGGTALGHFVTGVPPSPNLPYKAAVSKRNNTSFFRLQSPTDTAAQLTIIGEKPLMGDLNNDGWTDVVVVKSVSDYDTVLVYWGTQTGIDTASPLVIPNENRFEGLTPGSIGDINNDGKSDLILSAAGYPSFLTSNTYGKGKIYVYLNPVSSAVPNATVIGDTTSSGLGINCVLGDLNWDGYSDLIVRGWYQLGPTQNRYDYINIYWGVGQGSVNLSLGQQLKSYGGRTSAGLACFDANGDGIADLLWTNRDSSTATAPWYVDVHYGGSVIGITPNLRLESPEGVGIQDGVITSAGDMNGDGYSDVVVSSPDATTIAGFVFVFSGGVYLDNKYDAGVGLSTNARFGAAVASIGDINGDGLSDIIVGAPNYDFGSNKGYWEVLLGDTRIPTPVEREVSIPDKLELFQNYPNPFNTSTTIEFSVEEFAPVSLKVFDIVGREIATIVSEMKTPGDYKVVWDASEQSSGVYFYQMQIGDQRDTRKMLLLK